MPTAEDKDQKQNFTVTDIGERANNSKLLPDQNTEKTRECKDEEDNTASSVIKIENFKISSEANHLFLNASLLIEDGKRYGLVGLGNCERTTLLKHIANNPSGVDVLYWDKDFVDLKLPARKAVLKPSIRCNKLLAERKKLIAKQSKGNDTESIRNRLAELWNELFMIDPDGQPAQHKAANILAGLGLSKEDIDNKNIEEFKEKHLSKRVSLARALYLEPALLILDEPTAELDLDAVLWLENYLQDWEKALIVVSQDRCFLDNVCKEIILVNPQQFFYYKGNYSFFEKVFAQKQRKSLKKKERRMEKKLQLQADEKSVDIGVQTRAMTGRKSQNGFEVNGNGEGIANIKLLQNPEFLFYDPIHDFRRKGFLQFNGVEFGYEENKLLFDSLDLGINHKSRVAILGPSRAGKSTLLKIANKEIDVEGEVYLKPDAMIGKFSENEIDCLPSEESPLQYLCKKASNQETFRQKAAVSLIGLGLPNNRHSRKIKELTVNEKALIALAMFCLYPHDLLLLDEPTKYLSLNLIDALANAINQFKGAVLLATNNQFLIRETESDLMVIDEGGLDELYTFEKYRRKVLKNLSVPIRGPFTFIKRTEFKRDVSPIRVISDSKIILDYIAQNDNVDPNIKNIGQYALVFNETTSDWICFSPTLRGCSCGGKSKELCRKNMMYAIESWIEMLIKNGKHVPGPP